MMFMLDYAPVVADRYQSFEEAAGLMPARACWESMQETLRRHPTESGRITVYIELHGKWLSLRVCELWCYVTHTHTHTHTHYNPGAMQPLHVMMDRLCLMKRNWLQMCDSADMCTNGSLTNNNTLKAMAIKILVFFSRADWGYHWIITLITS